MARLLLDSVAFSRELLTSECWARLARFDSHSPTPTLGLQEWESNPAKLDSGSTIDLEMIQGVRG